MRQRYQPGLGGLARKGTSVHEAYWVENLDLQPDTSWRPRWGSKHIGTFTGDVTHISRPAGYNNHVMCIAESGKLIDVPVEDFASRSTVDTGWPTEPVASCISITTTGTNLWCACKAAIGGTAGPLKLYNGTTLNNPTTAPQDGNFVGMHGATMVRLRSGQGDNTAMQWSARGDANTWTSARRSPPIPMCGTTDAVVSLSPSETFVAGPNGIGFIDNSDDPDRMRFRGRHSITVATPMYHPVLCRDRVFFLAVGPTVCVWDPGQGGFMPIEAPLGRDLFLAQGTLNIRTWYDANRDEFVLWDKTQHFGYRFSLRLNRWVGIHSQANGADWLGQAVIDQGASQLDDDTQPWGKGFFASGPRLVQWDPSIYVDQTSGAASAAFTCKMETQVLLGQDPAALKQLQRIQVHGSGSVKAYLRHRLAPDGAWTTVTGLQDPSGANAAVSTPGVIYPKYLPEWREAVLGLEWTAASDVRFHSVELDHPIVSRPF